MPEWRDIDHLPFLYVKLDKLHLGIAGVVRVPHIERRRKFIITVVLVDHHIFCGPPRRHLYHIFAPSDVDISALKSVISEGCRDTGGAEQQIVIAKYGEGGFQIFVELLVVAFYARFFDEILVAAAKILALGVGFHKTMGGVESEDYGSGGFVGVVVGDLFHENVKTAVVGHHFRERCCFKIGVVETEYEWLFQIGVGIDVFVACVIGFVDFDVVALFELEYDLAI